MFCVDMYTCNEPIFMYIIVSRIMYVLQTDIRECGCVDASQRCIVKCVHQWVCGCVDAGQRCIVKCVHQWVWVCWCQSEMHCEMCPVSFTDTHTRGQNVSTGYEKSWNVVEFFLNFCKAWNVRDKKQGRW